MTLLDAAAGIANVSTPLPWLAVAGQPSAPQLAALHAAGVRTIIDLRDPMEPHGLDEAGEVAALGMTYVNAPVVSGALSDQGMEQVLAAMRAARGTPTLMHCNSANRTGGPLIAYLMLEDGVDEADAVDAAMRSGLRSVEYMEWGTSFARKHRAG